MHIAGVIEARIKVKILSRRRDAIFYEMNSLLEENIQGCSPERYNANSARMAKLLEQYKKLG